MQIKINRETLLKPLMNVTSIVERRHTLPILSDLEMQISLTVANSFNGELSTTISAKKFLDICRSLPDAVDIDMVTNESRMTVKAGKSRFNLQTLPAADYPVMTKAGGSGTNITISQLGLKKLFKQVEFAMAQQDIRYYLNGLLLEVNQDNLNIVGTDGHRLSFTSAQLNQQYDKTDVIIPRKTVIELIKLLNDSEEEVAIEINAGQVNFTFSDIRLISKVIDGMLIA